MLNRTDYEEIDKYIIARIEPYIDRLVTNYLNKNLTKEVMDMVVKELGTKLDRAENINIIIDSFKELFR